jgi:hypothetical protein
MTYLNKKNNNYPMKATAMTIPIMAIAIMLASTSIVTPVTAQQTTTISPSENMTRLSTPSTIKLSEQPVYQERVRTINQTQTDSGHTRLIISGNGTLTLPNSTETINTTSRGRILVSQEGRGEGSEVIRTKTGNERAIADFYEIARFNMQNGSGRGVIIALVHTNSTGKLAPLDGMMLIGLQEFTSESTSLVKAWEWQSGIPYSKMPPTMTTMEARPSPMNNTTNSTTTITTSSEPPSPPSSSSLTTPLTGP